MILEIVSLLVRPGQGSAFSEAFCKAERLLPTVSGYQSHELRQSLDNRDFYVLLIEWSAVEVVTLGFRKSLAFVRWQELLSTVVQTLTCQYFDNAKACIATLGSTTHFRN